MKFKSIELGVLSRQISYLLNVIVSPSDDKILLVSGD